MSYRNFILGIILTLHGVGCRVPIVDPGRNIIDGVPTLGADPCCPPEQHPGAGCKLGKCDRKRYGPRPICGDPLCDKVTSWHLGPDCDGRWLVLERLVGRRRVSHGFPLMSAVGLSGACETGKYTEPRTPADDESTLSNAILYFSLANSTTLNGLRIRDEDIIAYDGYSVARFLDGSDVGLGKLSIDAFAFLSRNEILVSFSEEFTIDEKHALPGISGKIDDSDVLLFTLTSIGEITRGTFSMYIDGSDVGLESDDADIDALAIVDDGRLIISTVGNVELDGVQGRDEDLLAFQPETIGKKTSGKWSLYIDGSDANLATLDTEDVNAVGIDGNGQIYLSTRGDFAVDEVKGTGTDVFVFIPEKLGKQTKGRFESRLYFDYRELGLQENDISGLELPTLSVPPTPLNFMK